MKQLRAHYDCPTELALEFLHGKWKTVILCWLKQAPHRYNRLRARMPRISDKVLTQRLHDLEELGLIHKAPDPSAPGHDAWQLTARGESLRPMLGAIYAWGCEIARELEVDVAPPSVHE